MYNDQQPEAVYAQTRDQNDQSQLKIFRHKFLPMACYRKFVVW